MKEFGQWIERTTGISPAVQEQIAATIIIVAGLWLLRTVIMQIVRKKARDYRTRYQWQKSTLYIAFALGTLLVGRTWLEGFGAVATYLGLVSAGLAIALKDPLTNLAGWLFIVWRRPFDVGDRIQIGDNTGDVIDQRLFQFTIMEIGNWVDADQSTGRILHIPNGKVFTKAQANYSQGLPYIWNELSLVVTFESDWAKAKALLAEIVATVTQQPDQSSGAVLTGRYTFLDTGSRPEVYTRVVENGVQLTARYRCLPADRRGSEQTVWERTLSAFAGHDDIRFAYPTQRLYLRPLEKGGESGASEKM